VLIRAQRHFRLHCQCSVCQLRVHCRTALFIDSVLVRIHFIIVIIAWTGLAPWAFEFPFPGSLTSTFLRFIVNLHFMARLLHSWNWCVTPRPPSHTMARCGRRGIEGIAAPLSLNIRSNRCRANTTHIRQSRPDSGLDFQQSFNFTRDSLFTMKSFAVSLLGGKSVMAM